ELHLGTGLSNATLGQISAATLEVGRSDGGNLVFDNDISTLASTVHLKSGQRVIGVNGGVSASRVAVSAGAGATLTDSRFDFSTLALSVGGDTEVQQLSHAGWSLGSVDGLNGLTVKAGSSPTVQLQAQGRLGLNAPLALNNSSATLQLQSASGFDAESAALSGQSRSTLEFSVSGAQSAVHIGGTGGQLSAASITKLAGVDTLRLLASDDTVLAHAFSASVQNKVDIQTQRLTVDGALSTSSGSLHLNAAQGGLQLDTAVTAANTLSLNDQAGVGISGRGVLTAPKLAVRSSGSVQLKPGSSAHQVDEIAAEVGDLAFKNSRRLTVGSADGLNGVRASGSVDLRSSGASSDLVLNQAVVASNSAKVALPLLLEAGRHFINNAGSSAVQASEGAWRIYSTDPRQDTRGGLTPAFKQYDASSASTVLGQGNGMLYRVAPVLQAQLSGTVSKIYDGNTTATLNANQLQITTGAIDGDSVSLGSAQAVYDSKNVGNGKTVSVSHMNITASAQAGSVAVYGYRSQAVSADIGVITPRSLDA
ncbi:MAG: YDG domain-containing protein, partial [Paucibacter sp.]|nr:YDG domain-containing protein [Roseateles sp.]